MLILILPLIVCELSFCNFRTNLNDNFTIPFFVGLDDANYNQCISNADMVKCQGMV